MKTLSSLTGSRFANIAGQSNIEITGLTADSREVKPGYLFAALPGTIVDGVRFAAQALKNGAVAVLALDGAEIEKADESHEFVLLRASDPRRELALMAAAFYDRQPENIVAITGTNGKTSVASFVRQIWSAQNWQAASLGTIGVVTPQGDKPLAHTTPEPVTLHTMLAEIAYEGVTHLALEASSHGLAQRRLDGIKFCAGAFTNISRDHLDYHGTFEDYFGEKLRLFEQLLPRGAPVVINVDEAGSSKVINCAKARGLKIFSVGKQGRDIKLLEARREGYAQKLDLLVADETLEVMLPLVGDFQTANALVAAGICMVTGVKAESAIAALADLKGACGRLEFVGTTSSGAPVFIDYAHTPDALANVLQALAPYRTGKLAVVFGCGGDRDRGKRPQMGAMAGEFADLVFVTDDNPRSEDPGAIRAEILTGLSGAREIADRAEAIETAIHTVGEGDLLLIAGKGHETGQIVGGKTIPFSDHDAVAAALEAQNA